MQRRRLRRVRSFCCRRRKHQSPTTGRSISSEVANNFRLVHELSITPDAYRKIEEDQMRRKPPLRRNAGDENEPKPKTKSDASSSHAINHWTKKDGLICNRLGADELPIPFSKQRITSSEFRRFRFLPVSCALAKDSLRRCFCATSG